MMHICTVATLCFPEKTVPRNYYNCVQDDNSLCLCFKNMYRTLFVAIFTSTFIFSMFKSSHTYRNINISNLSSTFDPLESFSRTTKSLDCIFMIQTLNKVHSGQNWYCIVSPYIIFYIFDKIELLMQEKAFF